MSIVVQVQHQIMILLGDFFIFFIDGIHLNWHPAMCQAFSYSARRGVSKLTTWKIHKVTFGTVCGSCLQGSCSRGLMLCEAKHGQWGGGGGGADEPLLEFGSVGSIRLGSRCGWVPFPHFSSPFLFKYCDSRTLSRTISETSKWLSRLSVLLQKSVFWWWWWGRGGKLRDSILWVSRGLHQQ